MSEDKSTDIKEIETPSMRSAKWIDESNNIIVVTGAGISVNSGIPDFRSCAGFYDELQKEYGFNDPETFFTMDTFNKDPLKFYTVSKSLFQSIAKAKPTKTHQFIAQLYKEERLNSY